MPFRTRLSWPACRQPWSPLPLAPSPCPASAGPQEASALFSLLTPLFALSLTLNLQVLFPQPPPPQQNSFSPLHGSTSPAPPQPQGPIGLLSCRSLPSPAGAQSPKFPRREGMEEAHRQRTGAVKGHAPHLLLPHLIPSLYLPIAALPGNCITRLFS